MPTRSQDTPLKKCLSFKEVNSFTLLCDSIMGVNSQVKVKINSKISSLLGPSLPPLPFPPFSMCRCTFTRD